MAQNLSYIGKHVLITGASSGLGKNLALNYCHFKKNYNTKQLIQVRRLVIGSISFTDYENDEFYKLFPNVEELNILEVHYLNRSGNPIYKKR